MARRLRTPSTGQTSIAPLPVYAPEISRASSASGLWEVLRHPLEMISDPPQRQALARTEFGSDLQELFFTGGDIEPCPMSFVRISEGVGSREVESCRLPRVDAFRKIDVTPFCSSRVAGAVSSPVFGGSDHYGVESYADAGPQTRFQRCSAHGLFE